jgi:hypothetical protein
MVGLLILFSIAGALTSIWLGGAVVYVTHAMGWANLLTLPPSDLALYIFGTLGPVATLWLVVGLLQNGLASHRQEKVLRTLAAQARQTAGQTEGQVRTLIQMQEESRRRSLIDGMDLVLKDLNGQAAVLAERLGMVSADEADSLWARTISGDVWAFAHAFLTRAAAYPDFADLLAERLAADDISTAALQLFRRRYDMLVASFEHSDADKVVRSVLEDGPLARLSHLFAEVDQASTRLRMTAEAAADEEATAAASGDDDETMTRLRDTLRRLDDETATATAETGGWADAAEPSEPSEPSKTARASDPAEHGEADAWTETADSPPVPETAPPPAPADWQEDGSRRP